MTICTGYPLWRRISRKPLKIEARFQWTTYRKWHMENRIITWPMTSRDLERSRSWHKYVWGPLSWKRLEIEIQLQWSTYRKSYMGYQMITCLMALRDPKRSRSWPRYAWSRISRKRLEMDARIQPIENGIYTEHRIVNVTGDVTLPRSKSWPQSVWSPLSRKRQLQWSTHTKWYMGCQMVTRSMTSRDPRRSRSWPQNLYGPVSPKRLKIEPMFKRTTNRKWTMSSGILMTYCPVHWNGHVTDDVTWPSKY